MAKYSIHHYQQNIHGRLHIACHNTLKITKIKIYHLPFKRINIMSWDIFIFSTNQ
jgi:hypothetical protein